MAKHNFVLLNGQVLQEPRIIKDDEGNYLRAMCAINVIRGERDSGDTIKNLRYDCPVIMTGIPEKIKEIETWHMNDMVEIKGVLTTKEVKKATICKECGQKNIVDGNVVYINPIFLEKKNSGLTKEDGLAFLQKRCEISNYFAAIGTLCREPDVYRAGKGPTVTQYQIAVNRKFRLKDDSAEIRTDYPWVKSYGVTAEDDARFLKKGTVIFLEGMIQTRDIVRTTVCENCGNSYQWSDSVMEIVPYEVEYLQNFISLEEQELKEQQEAEEANKILENL